MPRLLAGMAGLACALAAAAAVAQTPADTTVETPPDPTPAALSGLQAAGLRMEAAPTRAAVQVADPAIDQSLTLTNQGPSALVEFAYAFLDPRARVTPT